MVLRTPIPGCISQYGVPRSGDLHDRSQPAASPRGLQEL